MLLDINVDYEKFNLHPKDFELSQALKGKIIGRFVIGMGSIHMHY